MSDILNIDIETYSSVDIQTCGAYAYSASPDFEVLLFAYSLNSEPAEVIDLLSGEEIPQKIQRFLISPAVLKTAYNANFERTCLARWFKTPMPPEQWKCTAVHSSMLGMPPKLGDVAKVLNFPEDKQKMTEGKALIKYFCCPCKPTKINGGRTRNLPEHNPEKWNMFIEYNRQDVVVEQSIAKRLEKFPIPENEQRLWELDQRINDFGVRVDRELAINAISCDTQHSEILTKKAIELTGLNNPNSVAQLKKWLQQETGEVVDSLNKKTVPALLKKSDDANVSKVLELRQEMSKTSVKKYDAMLRSIGVDDRVRGILQFYGANRTGRWAGRIVQVQNLPKNELLDLELAREIAKDNDYITLDMLYESTPKTLSQLIRTTFISEEGNRFIIADFSAIEARVIAWLADEKWRMEVFNTHGKIYEASASQMFKVPLESITKGNPLRAKGKIAELALGYGGGEGALDKMGALEMGLERKELQPLVNAWREANPNIVSLWWNVGNAAIRAVKTGDTQSVRGISISCTKGMMFMELPSGRKLAYVRPKIELNKFNREGITFEGTDQTTKKWGRIETYGPKLVENLIQAISRDLLAEAMIRLDKAEYKIVMHVHDEVVADMPYGEGSLKEMCDIMCQLPDWVKGLPMRAEGFESEFYKKE